MTGKDELLALASTLDRAVFVERCPFPLLLAVNEPLTAPSLETFADAVTESMSKPTPPTPAWVPSPHLALYAVRKVNAMIPHGIIVGRSSTSDVVITDRQVSKTHAMFQRLDDHWELSDLGSSNGTCVNERRLERRGGAMPVRVGDVISFAYRTYLFVDADGAWDRLRNLRPLL